jgi:carbamoyl-phosphate synthase small subunit
LIRKNGAQNVAICYGDLSNLEEIKRSIAAVPSQEGLDLAKQVSCQTEYPWAATKIPRYKVVAIDYGIKHNILRNLMSLGCDVVVVPAQTSFDEIMNHNPDGVFLANGPGDPAATALYASEVIKRIVENTKMPLFCICLGHQLLALALGAKTEKMHQGHRGANHPVKNLLNGRVEITSQNHGFAVVEDTLPDNIIVTHRSLFDGTVEGIAVKNKPVFAVQYHPESSPGPNDSLYLFEQFIKNIEQYKNHA